MTIDVTSITGILKELQHRPDVIIETYKRCPVIAMIAKDTEARGEFIPQPLAYALSAGTSADMSRAQTRATETSDQMVKFRLDHVKNYDIIKFDNFAIEKAKSDKGAFVNWFETSVKAHMRNLVKEASIDIVGGGNGFKARGQIGSISTNTITLLNAADVYKFEIGMELDVSQSEAGHVLRAYGTSNRGLLVTAVNRGTGVITCSANITDATNGIPTATGNDFLFVRGDRENSATPTRRGISGFGAWLPGSGVTSTTFFNVNRTADPERLAGILLDQSGVPIEEAILNASERAYSAGGNTDTFVLHPRKFTDLNKSLGAKREYCEVRIKEVDFAFETITVNGNGGPITVVSDPNCGLNVGWALQLDTWKLYSMGDVPRYMRVAAGNEGGQVTEAASDGIEVRLGYYAQLGCNAPAYNVQVQL